MKKRIGTFDIAKGIAILLVVFGHALQGIRDSEALSIHSEYSSIYIVCAVIYSFHMPLFFFVSGLFAQSWGRRSFSEAAEQKIRLLVIPYFVWTIIVGVCMQAVQRFTNNGLGIKQVLISWRVPFSEYWFLYVLFFIFIIYYIFVNLSKNGQVYLLGFSVLLYLLGPVIPNVWIVRNIQSFLIFFALGSVVSKRLLRNYNVIFTRRSVYLIAGTFTFLVVLYVYFLRIDMDGVLLQYYRFAMAMVGITFVLEISHVIDTATIYLKTFFNWNGINSMGIYVMHLLPLAGSRILAIKVCHLTNLWGIAVMITLISVISCYVAYFVFYRLKLTKLLFGR